MFIATSWDDGLVTDLRLVSILEKYSANASFAINSRLHHTAPVLNDSRSSKYGFKLPFDDLMALSPYDICNHTSTHDQIDSIDEDRVESIIRNGKKELEDIFGKSVCGIVWPYGIFTKHSIHAAKMSGHTYGRTTSSKGGCLNGWNITPINWRTDPQSVIDGGHDAVTYGHTYEMLNQDDWELVERMYYTYSTDSRCTLVTMTQLMENRFGRSA
jgi:peptidoglycan/xylan/chitin deacetylase (PgdA/CDA1 family)